VCRRQLADDDYLTNVTTFLAASVHYATTPDDHVLRLKLDEPAPIALSISVIEPSWCYGSINIPLWHTLGNHTRSAAVHSDGRGLTLRNVWFSEPLDSKLVGYGLQQLARLLQASDRG